MVGAATTTVLWLCAAPVAGAAPAAGLAAAPLLGPATGLSAGASSAASLLLLGAAAVNEPLWPASMLQVLAGWLQMRNPGANTWNSSVVGTWAMVDRQQFGQCYTLTYTFPTRQSAHIFWPSG